MHTPLLSSEAAVRKMLSSRPNCGADDDSGHHAPQLDHAEHPRCCAAFPDHLRVNAGLAWTSLKDG